MLGHQIRPVAVSSLVTAGIILYVEDDDAAFALVKLVLKEKAPRIHLFRARDGEEALTILQLSGLDREMPRPDLILLDINLPKRNGLEVLAILKASEALHLIPVVMFSTSSAANDKSDAMGAGAQRYVTKPFNFEQFVEAVKTAVSID